MVQQLLAMAMPFMQEMEADKKRNEEKVESILAEWRTTKNLPRKQKKQRRKELQIDYSFFKWAGELFNYEF